MKYNKEQIIDMIEFEGDLTYVFTEYISLKNIEDKELRGAAEEFEAAYNNLQNLLYIDF